MKRVCIENKIFIFLKNKKKDAIETCIFGQRCPRSFETMDETLETFL